MKRTVLAKFASVSMAHAYVNNFEKAIYNFDRFVQEDYSRRSESLKVLFAGR
jgi:hypothetical protein